MGFIKRGGGERQLVTEGEHPAVCVDIVDLGLQDTKYGPKHKVQFIFASDETLRGGEYDGQPALLFATFSNTSSSQGNLRPFVEAWSGGAMSDDEIEALERDEMVGQPATVTVEHNEGAQGDVFANIAGIAPGTDDETLPEWMTEAIKGYTRPEKVEAKAQEGQRRARDADKPAPAKGGGGRKFGKR